MKRFTKIKFFVIALALIAVALSAIGCAGKDHTHTYSDEWVFDATSHWHPSSCSHDTKANKSDHVYIDSVIKPSLSSAGYTVHICACGYSYVTDPTDSLPAEGLGYRYDENGHWKTVLSGESVTPTPHEYTQTVVAPTCSTYGYTKHDCECGYWYADSATAPTAHEFDDEVWGHDENSHWQTALCCGFKGKITAHNYIEKVTPATCDEDGFTEFICADCGYSFVGRTVLKGHTYSDTLSGDEYEHYREATCSHGTEKADIAEHALVGRSNVCVVCGVSVTPRLEYELSTSGEYYIVKGLGCIDNMAITIPDTYRSKPVKEVAERAFKGSDITSVSFGANVEKIGTEAFMDTRITAVQLGAVKDVGTKAFAETDISTLTLGTQIEKMGNAAFRDCKELQTVTISGSLTVLPPYAFGGCDKLTSVTAASKLTEVGAQAFSDCVALTTLDLSGCLKVGFAAFGGCEKFVPVLTSLTEAEEYAFSGCAAETVTLPATLSSVADYLFYDCAKLKTVNVNSKAVGAHTFEGCVLLDTVTLTGVTSIGDAAFEGCEKLNSLTLPESVIHVGKGAFAGTGLISEEDGVKYAAGVVIGAAENTTSVTVKAGAVGIADGALRGSSKLSSLDLGGVRFIGKGAFRDCTLLTAVTFPASVTYIDANAFRESGLTSVTVPATVLSVGDNAFYDCKSLTSVTVNAKEIGKFAFSYTGVGRTLGSPVKQRPDYAKLTTLVIGEGVEEIGSNAFQYCPITSVTLPESLKTIGKYAFAQTDLTSVTIPAAVTRIGEYAFYDCKSLTSATFDDAEGWKAGKTSLSLSSAATNATYLKTTYRDIDWIKG